MKYGNVEKKLRKAMESAIEKGWAPMPGPFTGNHGTCCALGALFVNEAFVSLDGFVLNLRASFMKAAERLRIDYNDAAAIASGFDGEPRADLDQELVAVGARIRRDYYECDS